MNSLLEHQAEQKVSGIIENMGVTFPRARIISTYGSYENLADYIPVALYVHSESRRGASRTYKKVELKMYVCNVATIFKMEGCVLQPCSRGNTFCMRPHSRQHFKKVKAQTARGYAQEDAGRARFADGWTKPGVGWKGSSG